MSETFGLFPETYRRRTYYGIKEDVEDSSMDIAYNILI